MDHFENTSGGQSVALTAGDRLRDVPTEYKSLVTREVAAVFADVPAYFSKMAADAPSGSMRAWLLSLLREGRWRLNLHRYLYPEMLPGKALFEWSSDAVLGAQFSLPDGRPSRRAPKLLRRAFRSIGKIYWNGYCLPGTLYAPVPVLNVIGRPPFTSSGDPEVPWDEVEESFAWGEFQLDTLVASPGGGGDWWTHKVIPMGTLQQAFDWAFEMFLRRVGPTADDATKQQE